MHDRRVGDLHHVGGRDLVQHNATAGGDGAVVRRVDDVVAKDVVQPIVCDLVRSHLDRIAQWRTIVERLVPDVARPGHTADHVTHRVDDKVSSERRPGLLQWSHGNLILHYNQGVRKCRCQHQDR